MRNLPPVFSYCNVLNVILHGAEKIFFSSYGTELLIPYLRASAESYAVSWSSMS